MKLSEKKSIYFIFLFSIFSTCFSQSPITRANAKTQELAKSYFTGNNIPGMAITVSVNDSIVYSKGFGVADIEKKTPVTPSETKFRIASITKTITAATICKLSELGQIDLKKSPYFYLDSLPKKTFDFTIEEIGAHLSGIRRVPSEEKYTCDNTYSRNDFYKVFEKDKLLFEPSTKFEYSNYGYKLLGVLIEKTTGQSVIANQNKYVIGKIGLKNTFPETNTKDSLTSKFYISKNKKLIEAPCLDCTFKYAQGCYLSTAEDLVKLGNAYLYPNRILKKETLVEMIKTKTLKSGWKTNYGFGFGTNKDSFGNFNFGHTGGYDGSKSCLAIYPSDKIVIAVLVNRDVYDIGSLVAEISNNYSVELK